MAEGWDQLAVTWEKDESNIEFAEKAFAELTKEVSLEGCHVLDFGCGTGLLSQLISPHAKSIVALDASESMIEELDKKELVNVEPVVDTLTRGLVAQHPAFRKQFNLIVAGSVCGYLSHLAGSLAVVYSLLDKGGKFIHWDFISDDEDRASGVGMVEMQDELIQAGFSEVRVSRAFRITHGEKQLSMMMGIAIK
ncbi:class I SAM-dependent DNA methyltransferase [Vibrio quintilis]|uniref:Mg-protoporphyrin IX methyl transferase n=1 Tax=Vibrio quintilis TaxID=1117707 RepID=A0A1M7YX25_9VIBR|nr:methyltransferase [Vibrio quintilis]SHO57063.1 Mg-protoporphyrin IX methyl transferase [Vibrio quintilis]